MIFTDCPTCNYIQAFPIGNPSGKWLASRCRKCKKVMWVEMTRTSKGVTLDTETLLAHSPEEDHQGIREIETRAIDHSTIIEED